MLFAFRSLYIWQKLKHMKNTFTNIHGTTFAEGTNEQLVNAIENARAVRCRVRVWYGDKDGKSWNEENDITGHIGRTTGNRSPILLHNCNSMGGGLLMTDSIVKMVNTRTGNVMYQHENFNQSVFTANGTEVYQDSELYARCKSEKSACRLADFMNGKRHSK